MNAPRPVHLLLAFAAALPLAGAGTARAQVFTVAVAASCATGGSGAGASTESVADAVCPDGMVVTGGGFALASNSTATILASGPVQIVTGGVVASPVAVEIVANAWRVRADPCDSTVVARAVCVPGVGVALPSDSGEPGRYGAP